MTKVKNTLEKINSRISEAEEGISELEDKMVAITSEERGEESRWRRNRTGWSLSLLQIHQKNNRTVNKDYKTTSDH